MINKDKLSSLETAINVRFKKGLRSNPAFNEELLATVVPSNAAIETYPLTVFMDTMRKWVGPRQIGMMMANLLSITNVDYEATIGVPVNDVRRDKYGIYADISEGKGQQCRSLWGKLVTQSLTANGKWLDGSAFFLANRKFGGSTICNLTNDPLSASSLSAAILAMSSYTGYDGEPIGIVPNLLVAGPKNRDVCFQLTKDEKMIIATGRGATSQFVGNPNRGLVDYQINPYLVGAYDDYWYLACTTMPLKPCICQKEYEGPLVALDKPTDPNVFMGTVDGNNAVPGGVILYGAHYVGAAAPAMPHLIYAGIL